MARNSRARRALWGVVVSGALVASGAGGWAAAEKFQSPAQLEAAAQPPAPGPVTVSVASGDLAEVVNAQAQISRSTPEQAALQLPDGVAVVTAAQVSAGATITAGTVVRSVNDRPVFAVPGTFPFYRDIGQGDAGADVRQLQDGLRAAGLTVRDREMGTFGSDTARAVRALYKAGNYAVATQTVEPLASDAAPSSDAVDGTAAAPPAPVARLVVPRSEVVVIGTLPAVMLAAPSVGTVLSADTAVLDLESGALTARAAVAVSVASRVQVGALVTLDDGAGTTVEATVGSVVPATQDGEQAQVVFQTSGVPLPDAWVSASVLATITLQIVAEESLIVPTIAVVPQGASSPHVLKELPGGSFRSVPVKELGTLSGRSAVVPEVDGDLAAGDVVRVD